MIRVDRPGVLAQEYSIDEHHAQHLWLQGDEYICIHDCAETSASTVIKMEHISPIGTNDNYEGMNKNI